MVRLEEKLPSIKKSYAYPLKDLLDHLRVSTEKYKNEVEEEEGKAVKYYLYFSSPSQTWKSLCGRAGFYTIDAVTLKSLHFQLTVMS